MEQADAKAYIERWQEVKRIENEEAQAANIQDRWQQLNMLFGMALGLDLFSKPTDNQEELVWKRWAMLRGIEKA